MTLASHAARTTRLLSSSSIALARLASLNSQLSPKPLHNRKMSSLPKTMKAVQIEKTGGTDVLQYKTDVPVPEPKEGEVLVKNEFVGINYIDT
jgi:NADPH2:quinone reductase